MAAKPQFENNGQIARIKKNDTVTVDSTNPAGMVLAKGVDSLPLDRWNSERAAYQTAYSYDNSGYGSKSMSGSGYSDLAYYGGFQFLPGYGMVWQPYGASSWMGWDPYIVRGLDVHLRFGQYAWASAYPWGWMPYHYGSWIYVPAGGWFWSPGNSFRNGGTVTNWQPTAPVVKGPAGYAAPTPPSQPVNGARPSVLVGRIGTGPAYIPGGPVPPNFRSCHQRQIRPHGYEISRSRWLWSRWQCSYGCSSFPGDGCFQGWSSAERPRLCSAASRQAQCQ